jgi:hypothetical protein
MFRASLVDLQTIRAAKVAAKVVFPSIVLQQQEHQLLC